MHHYRLCTLILFSLLLFASCRQLIGVDTPSDELPSDMVYSSDQLADAAVADIYTQLSGYFAGNMMPVINGMTADELSTLSGAHRRYVNNAILSDDGFILSCWRDFYKLIYGANAVLEGLTTANGMSTIKIQQLGGEARFLRAFCYYYMVNCWGDVPLITTTNVNKTALARRTATDSIYKLIVSDLQWAGSVLPAAYSSGEKVRATKWAAIALLARIYLQMGNWEDAMIQSSNVINAGMYTTLAIPDSVFLRNSRSAILQVWRNEGYTYPGQTFLPVAEGSISFYPFTDNFMERFETGDKRRDSWSRSFVYAGSLYYYCYKYRNRTATTDGQAEYLMVLRIEEQFLIRAEAMAQLNNITAAITDLNILRARAGLPLLSDTMIKDSCLLAVEKERRMELFTEWGDRWIGLKRTGRLNMVIGALKTGWKSSAALYPIPQEERNRNPNLTQNEGYQ